MEFLSTRAKYKSRAIIGIDLTLMTFPYVILIPVSGFIGFVFFHFFVFERTGILGFFFGIAVYLSAASFWIRGEYRWQNFERSFLVRYLNRKSNIFFLNPFSIFTATKEGDVVGLNSGSRFIAFRLDVTESEEYQTAWKNSFNQLLKVIPMGTHVQVLRLSKTSDSELRKFEGTQLIQYEMCVYVTLPFAFNHNSNEPVIRDALKTIGKPMSLEEVKEVTHSVLNPFSAVHEQGYPVVKQGTEINLGEFAREAACISLADEPEFVTTYFSDFWNAFQSLPGVVSLKFQKVTYGKANRGFWEKWLHHKVSGDSLVEETKSDAVNLTMQAVALIHGERKEIQEALTRFDVAVKSVDMDLKPSFAHENAFVKSVLESIQPGILRKLTFRTHKVSTSIEAFSYLPSLPLAKSQGALQYRSVNNMLVSLRATPESPTLVVGKMKAGKSVLLGGIILQNYERGEQEGFRTASFIMEAGSSFRFLEYFYDVVFSLSLKAESGLIGLHNPLEVMLSFGKVGIESATMWLCKIGGLPHGVDGATEHQLIAEALQVCLDKEAKNIKAFCTEFAYVLLSKKEYKNIMKKPEHPLRKFLTVIESMFSSTGRFGSFFDPPETGTDYRYSKHFYVNKAQGNVPEGLMSLESAFYDFAIHLNELLEIHFSPEGEFSCEMLVVFDEFHFYKNKISLENLSQANRQGRKLDRRIYMASQVLTDALLDVDGFANDKRYGLLETCKRIIFHEFGTGASVWAKALSLGDDGQADKNPIIQKIKKIAEINVKNRSRSIYSWGIVDEFKRVHHVIEDVPADSLWVQATQANAKNIKNKCMEFSGKDYFKVCKSLANKGFEIPDKEENLSEDYLRGVIAEAFNLKLETVNQLGV